SGVSVYDALPSANSSYFIIMYGGSDFLNCTVIGPNSKPYYHVVTDPLRPGYTVFKNKDNNDVALVKWQPRCQLEIHDI
ncbi:hypothetical protein K435DRAFT_555898, partial [Dendrothele bispora CBS 962.96]